MTVEMLIARYGLPALFLAAGIEGEAVVVTGGLFARQGLIPLVPAMLCASGGSFFADQLLFTLGRRYRDHPRVQRIATKPAFARALKLLEAHPNGFIFGFRFIYGLRTVSPIAIGASKVGRRRFLVLNAVAATLWGSAFTLAGYIFGDAIVHAIGRIRAATQVWPVAVALFVVAGVIAIVLRRRHAAMPPPPSAPG